jgi:hypothetical protein
METNMTTWQTLTPQPNRYPSQPTEPYWVGWSVKQAITSVSGLDRQTITHIQSNVSLAQQSLKGDDLTLAAEYLSQAVQLLSRVAPAVIPPQPSPKPQPKSDDLLSGFSRKLFG